MPTASRIWGSGQMDVALVCLGAGVSVRVAEGQVQDLLQGRGERPALRNHQAKGQS